MSEPTRKALINSAYDFLARMEGWEMNERHAVITFDPETNKYGVVGPFVSPMLALQHADRLDKYLNDPANNDGPKITVTVAEYSQIN